MTLKSIALNIWGDLFFLCEGGEIRYVSLKREGGEGSSLPRILPLENTTALVDSEISNIEFNISGSILLLASPFYVGVALLPRAYSFDGCQSLYSDDVDVKRKDLFFCQQGESIVKIQWHPLSEKHLVILLDTCKLLVVDVVDSEMLEYELDAAVEYTSFCFGPGVDWLRLTVFLLHASGDISYMCPVLPMGSVLSAAAVAELRAWQQEQMYSFSSFDTPGVSGGAEGGLEGYLDKTSLYLRAALGQEGEGGGGRGAVGGQPHRAGVLRGGTRLTSGSKLFGAFYGTPAVQGPVQVECRVHKTAKGKANGKACDLSTLTARDGGSAVPLLLVVWSDGDVEELLIGDGVSGIAVCRRAELPVGDMCLCDVTGESFLEYSWN